MRPISIGMPKSRVRPIAVPMTSAMSVAMIAISARAQSRQERARQGVSAGLRQIPLGSDGEARAQMLREHRHQARQDHDGQKRVTELRAACQ